MDEVSSCKRSIIKHCFILAVHMGGLSLTHLLLVIVAPSSGRVVQMQLRHVYINGMHLLHLFIFYVP